jgi:hypothetical protein
MLRTCFGLVFAVLCVAPVLGEGPRDTLKSGDVAMQSAGALTFGPDGILFVGDSTAGAIVAIDTGDTTKADKKPDLKVEKIDGKIASLLGVEAGQLAVNNIAVNPLSGNLFLSVTRGKGAEAKPVLLKLDGSGKLTEVSLKGARSATAQLPNTDKVKGKRQDVITNMAYVKGVVYVAGLSNEEFASTLRAIPFPFNEVNKGTGVGIFHGAHGRFETASPVRTFVPYEIAGETNLLAAYTCTPLVKFPVSQLKPGEKVKGTTIAELGNMNSPLDMIVYTKGGKDFILIANTARGIMKVPTEGMAQAEGITEPVKGGITAGHKYEKIEKYKGVQRLAKIDNDRGVILVRNSGGDLNVETIELP